MSLYGAAAKESDGGTVLSRRRLAGLCVLAVALLPPAYAFASRGIPAAFDYFAADAFVYLSIAANSHAGFYTFDGVHPTNGFHPLWQMLLQAMFQVLGIGAAKEQQLMAVFWLSVVLVAAGGMFVARATLRWSGSALAALLTVPGLFGVAMLFCGWPAGTMWRYMNGMESPASLFFFGLLLLHLSQPGAEPMLTAASVSRRRLLVLSLLCAGFVLSRLDDIFLPAAIAGWFVLKRSVPARLRLRALLWFGLPLGAALLAYLGFNILTVGQAMPVSGAAKFDIRTPLINLGFLGSSLHAMVPDFLYDPFSGSGGDVAIADINWRNAQMLLPVITARILLANMQWLTADRTGRFAAWMRLLLVYVMAKGIYNFLFVPLLHQGHWYYALSIAIVNVAFAVLAARLCAKLADRTPLAGKLAPPAAAALTAAALLIFVHSRADAAGSVRYIELFRNGPRVAAALRAIVPAPRIVEADDGIVNYALGLPTMSGFLFAIDPAAYDAYRDGRFLTEASARGYQLIGSLYYLRNVPPADLTPEKIPAILREHLFNATDWDLERFDFALAYRDETSGAVFIRFTPKK
jgi:hypothetical protein